MSSERKRKWDQATEEDAAAPEPNSTNVSGGDAKEQAAAVAAQLNAKYSAPGSGSSAPEKVPDENLGFVKDIEINDLRNRYMLTKSGTQSQISEETKASVTTKGQWYPDKSLVRDGEAPLYLHITASTQSALDAAVGKVNEIIDQDLGPLTERPGFRERPEKKKWPEEKVFIGLESIRNFNVRARIVGPQGMFVKYIQSETGARVQIKGQGSGFYESETGLESEEPMHINLAAPEQQQVDKAVALAEDLLEVVREKHEEAKKVMDQYTASLNQQQASTQAYYQQYYAAYQQQYQQQQQQQQQAAQQSPQVAPGAEEPAAASSGAPAASTPAGGEVAAQSQATPAMPNASGQSKEMEDWWKQVSQMDPRYQAYVYQYYQQYYNQGPGQQGQTPGSAQGATAPPAPPPAQSQPTPPPPPPEPAQPQPASPPAPKPQGGKAYSAVPPPAGL